MSSADSESSQLLAVSSLTSVDLDHPASQQVDRVEECRHLQGLVKKLKSDRKALQNLLLDKESDIKQLLQAKAEVELELQKWQNKMEEKTTEEQTLSCSEEIQNVTQKVGKLESKLEQEKSQIAEDTMEKLNESSPVCTVKGKEDRRKEQAAKIIQRQWKMYRNKKEEIALDEAVVMLQAAFRGHLARQKLLLNNRMHDAKSHKNSCMSSTSTSLSLSSDCKEKDEIVTFIQSIFRAHLARTVLLEERPSVSSAPSEKADSAVYITEKKPVSAALQRPLSIFVSPLPARSSEKQSQPILPLSVDETHSDDSDDIVIVSPLLQMKKNYTHF